MKLNSGPFVRTLVASLVLLLALAAVTGVALAREIRIFPTPGFPAGGSAGDLVLAAAGLAPTTGPDAGVAPGPGDTLVLAPGTYTLVTAAAPPADGTGAVVIPGAIGYNGTAGFPAMENLKIRSRDGANVTVITGPALVAADVACVIVGADGVEIGGPGADQGVTIRNCGAGGPVNVDGIQIGTPIGPTGLAITPAGQADEHLTVQNNILLNNGGDGVHVVSATNLDSFKVVNNTFRDNVAGGAVAGGPAVVAGTAAQLHIAPGSSIGTRGPDRNVIIEGNTFDGDTTVSVAGIVFNNAGTIEQTAILNNQILRHLGFGIVFLPVVTDFEDSVIAGNFVQQNGVVGILWANTGRIENVKIDSNKGTTPFEGITGNGFAGAVVLPSVTDVRDSEITNNNFNSNTVFMGLGIFNATDFETSTVAGNSFRQNGGSGLIVFNTGDQDEILYQDNEFRNNGVLGAGLVATVGRIQNHTFDGNLFSQNSVLGLGLVVFSSQDVESTSFVNGNVIEKNGGGAAGPFTPLTVFGSGLALISGGGGDVGEVSFDDLSVLENTGNGALLFTTTGDVTNIDGSNSRFENNGGMGLAMNALTPVAGAFLAGDIDTVNLSDSSFSFNGTRTAAGFGSGLFFRGDNVDTFNLTNVTASSNNDHGAQWSANSDINNINVQGGAYDNNDRNFDSVGNGLDVSSNDTAADVTINEVSASGNNTGVRFNVAGRTGRDLVVTNSTINDNRDAGIAFFGSEDLNGAGAEGNTINGNSFGINFTVNEDGTGLFARGNEIIGNDGQGTGVLLDASGVTVEDNSIRRNDVGIEVRKMERNGIHNNNIARNESFGIDATALSPGSSIDASSNWWGEPSGPKHSSNPNGIGDRVSDKVDYDPFLTEPAVPTDVNFEITAFNVPATANAGETVTITATVTNTGSEEGSQEITLDVSASDFVTQKSVTKTINPSASTEVTFDVNFPKGGTFTVTLTTQNDSAEATIEVAGPTGLTIEEVIDANDNNRIDDDEILTAIGFWVSGDEVPGTGQTIGDSKILFLIELWVTNGDISTLPASAQAQQSKKGWLQAVVNFFAPAAEVSQVASATEVAPGESFTVTTTIRANETLQGLLLSEQLPAGWTVSEATTAGGFYNARGTKWLWLSGKNITVSYTVHVPADAPAGSYALDAALRSAQGLAAAHALRVRVRAPEALRVDKVAFTGSRFVALGAGIAGLQVQVYGLDGRQVFAGSSRGAALSFEGQNLANGVYLYVVTVRGLDGRTVRTGVGKLIVLR